MFTDVDNHQYQLQHPSDVMYDVDGANETSMDYLTDWQLAALTGLDAKGQECLIGSWKSSPFGRKSCCI